MLHHLESLLLQVPATLSTASAHYVERQLRDIAKQLGSLVGQSLDEDRLRETVRQSTAAYTLLWDAVRRCGHPFLMLDVDINDRRTYTPGQVRTRLDAFVELLDQPRH